MFEKLKVLAARLDELEMRLSAPDLYDDPDRAAKLLRERNELEPIVTAFREYERAQRTLADATEMLSDPDMKELAQEELQQAKSDIARLEGELKSCCCPRTRTTRRISTLRFAAVQAARKARCLPLTSTACIRCTPTSAAGRPRS